MKDFGEPIKLKSVERKVMLPSALEEIILTPHFCGYRTYYGAISYILYKK